LEQSPKQDSKGLHELAFVSGHDFSRAETDPKVQGLQPPREEIPRSGITEKAPGFSPGNMAFKKGWALAPEDFGGLHEPAFVSGHGFSHAENGEDERGFSPCGGLLNSNTKLAFVSGHDFSRAETDPKIEGL